jgi:hypothetical protein
LTNPVNSYYDISGSDFMNEKIILKYDLNKVLPLEKALSYLKIDETSEQYDEVTILLDKAYKLGKPCGVFRECYIEDHDSENVTIDGIIFKGALIAEKLSEIHRVFPYIASCGLELSTWADSLQDELMKFYANTFNQYVVGAMSSHVNKMVMEYSGVEKFATLNPGSLPDWPITQQRPLFKLLDGVTDEIGVCLTPSCLMIPIKSVSGILFPSSTEWFNCMRCRRLNCPGRQAKYIE